MNKGSVTQTQDILYQGAELESVPWSSFFLSHLRVLAGKHLWNTTVTLLNHEDLGEYIQSPEQLFVLAATPPII